MFDKNIDEKIMKLKVVPIFSFKYEIKRGNF